ncbi:amino acid permease [Flavihumibacter sp. R14]|nr:amino acid permease [Flavihumibacter soli]
MAQEKKLKRTLGVGECIFFGVGSILGAGIYTLIGKVAGFAGNLTWLAFMIACVTALCTVFSYAELSAAYPKAGAEYVYSKHALGKKTGVFLGLMISINGIISGATVAVGFAGYFIELIPVNMLIASLAIIFLIFLTNVAGIRQSSVVNIIFTLIEAGGLVFVIVIAFPYIGEADLTTLPPGGPAPLLQAAALSFFAYIGFEEIVKLAEETKQPEKNIPRALFSASIIVMVFYALIAISAVSVIPWEELAESKSPLADIVDKGMGSAGATAITIIALFSTSNTILSNMLGSSRVILNISEETKLLNRFATVSKKRKTPVAALLLILIVMSTFSLIGKIEVIAMIANFFIFITFLFVNLSVILLRSKEFDRERPFRIPINIKNVPVISVVGIVLTLILMGFNIHALIISGFNL